MKKVSDYQCDVLVIGSGVAGLSLAIRLAQTQRVIILSKGPIQECASFYAQGGIAAVFDEMDSIEAHIEDTLISGAGLCDHKIVDFVIRNARHCIEWLIKQGVSFDKETPCCGKERYHLMREGGHSHRRVLHSADTTGREIVTVLISRIVRNSNIHILEYANVIDLILSDHYGFSGTKRVLGAWIWKRNPGKIEICSARVVVLATGGAANVYQYTTNPDVTSGDGIAMAWRAGCRVANLEFNQFHPTCLYHPQARNFLLTESLRGEGAYLRLPNDGDRFMFNFDARGELAPRDIVVRAIDHEMKRLGVNFIYIDISHRPADFIRSHFPEIDKKLYSLGFDLTCDPIPIVPAAHYTCGGVIVDRHGRTDVKGLYAIGEVSYTGLHGANRLASNSLIECLVYAWSTSEDILVKLPHSDQIVDFLPVWNNKKKIDDFREREMIESNWNRLRILMWDNVGIVRTTKRLEYISRYIALLQQEIKEYYRRYSISNNLLNLQNLTQVAELITNCALQRKESRGLHYILDYPEKLSESTPTILVPLGHIKK